MSMSLDVPNSPLVSVVMCTYNGAAFLDEQIKSILQQTYAHIELVAVDDASTDKTVELLYAWAQRDARIKVYVNEKNLGYNKNFEKAFSLSQGSFIAVSDQDDVWHHEKINIMMREWPAGAEMIYSISSNFDSDNPVFNPGNTQVNYKSFNEPAMLVFDSPVHGHACMLKKEFALLCAPYPEKIFYDWWQSMFAAAKGALGFINHTLTWHRVHAANFSLNVVSISDEQERKKALIEQKIMFIE
jgi:glycosyltransferase involved in cell wall biosynthesis